MILTDADELRLALVGVEASLVAEREHSERLQRECEERHDELRRERDEARAEVEKLREENKLLRHDADEKWGAVATKCASAAERQREACAAEAAGVACRGHGMDADEEGTREACVDAVRATPLVTDAKAAGGAT